MRAQHQTNANTKRQDDRKAKFGDIKQAERILRGKLTKLNEQRHHSHFIKESDAGRLMLKALFRFGLTLESASNDAPWAPEGELKKLQRAARGLKWKTVGPLINLTTEEWEARRLWQLVPCDKTAEELKQYRADRRRKRDAERRREKRKERREKREWMSSADKRDNMVMRILDKTSYRTPEGGFAYEWMPVSAVLKYALEDRAFRDIDEWGRLRRLRNPRGALHVVLKRLGNAGVIEVDMRRGLRGLVLWVRKVSLDELMRPGKADVSSDGRGLLEHSTEHDYFSSS